MKLKAWIQNTDENQEDFVLKDGKLVDAEADRQKYVNLMFDIQKNGKCIHSSDDLSIFRSKKDRKVFMIDMSADNRDIHNRRVAVMMSVEDYLSDKKDKLSELIDKTFEKTNTEVSSERKDKILEVIENSNNIVRKLSKPEFNKLSNKTILILFILSLLGLILYILNSK